MVRTLSGFGLISEFATGIDGIEKISMIRFSSDFVSDIFYYCIRNVCKQYIKDNEMITGIKIRK